MDAIDGLVASAALVPALLLPRVGAGARREEHTLRREESLRAA
jgi:hypothetical protein